MTPADFEYVTRLIRDRSAVVLESGKEYLVESRLTPIVGDLKLGSISDLVTKLRLGSDPTLITRVVEAMCTTETSFFRDMIPFESLRKIVLPELIRRRANERRLDIWSAACSTGQEPYSLAILLREHFPTLAGWRVNLLATDLSSEVLGRAKEGRFTQLEVNRGLPVTLLVKYFTQHGTAWEASDEIRRMIEFRPMNLARPWLAMPRMDLIFLRNVMIYFDTETKKGILGQVAKLLRPDGYLVLGTAETALNLEDSLRRVDAIKGGFFQLVG